MGSKSTNIDLELTHMRPCRSKYFFGDVGFGESLRHGPFWAFYGSYMALFSIVNHMETISWCN
jgi:hypothetical protein